MGDEMTGQVLAALERINVRLDRIDTRLDVIDTRLDIVERQAAERHAELVGKINRVEAKVDRLEIKVDRLHDDMDDVKHRINTVDITVAQWGTSVAIQNGRDLRFDARRALVEKRLEIRDNPGA